MTEEQKKAYGSTIRIENDVMEMLIDEQFRLRKLEGKKLTYSEILRRALAAYASGGRADEVKRKKPPK